VELEDNTLPIGVKITGFSPFIPLESDDSSLPVAGLEYEVTNTSREILEATFSFHSENLMRTNGNNSAVKKSGGGLICA